MNSIKEYELHSQKIGNRKDLYRAIMIEYSIKTALYPGSYIDIAPSIVIEDVTYVDSFKGANNFFEDMDVILSYIETHKEYSEMPRLRYFYSDYSKLEINLSVDLLISQYAGFVGQETKKFLKKGGILLCNDSHGDATLAFLDDDYELIGVVDSNKKIVTNELDSYFKFKRSREIDVDKVRSTMKGPKYKLMTENYIFRKSL